MENDFPTTRSPSHQPLVMISLRCADGESLQWVEGAGITFLAQRYRPMHGAHPSPQGGGMAGTASVVVSCALSALSWICQGGLAKLAKPRRSFLPQ